MWDLPFISEEDFHAHVANTIQAYADSLYPIDVKRFNANTIDPVKLVFDKSVYGYSWDEVIKSEVFRQRDKSNNNSIGYFHQKIFGYIANCEVPPRGWDVIYKPESQASIADGIDVAKVYVEMKNKHNTMNSASAGKTYIKMQGQLLNDDSCACFLVEAIAKQSQNTQWDISVDGVKQGHRLIRRVSLDRFYQMVTGDPQAFYKVCIALPAAIDHVMQNVPGMEVPNDLVMQELLSLAGGDEQSIPMALFYLGFADYIGFVVE